MTTRLEHLAGETRSEVLRLLRRSRQTITALAETLHLTDNAVRTHIAALERDGLVEHAGSRRDTGGKPARLYTLTPGAEELFPKAYALVLGGLVQEIVRDDGRARAVELLGRVGRQVGSSAGLPDDPEARISAAAAALRGLGGDVEVQRTEDGWKIQGYGCPLSAVTADHAEVCELARAMVQEIIGRPVTECCDRGERPRCGFGVRLRPVTSHP